MSRTRSTVALATSLASILCACDPAPAVDAGRVDAGPRADAGPPDAPEPTLVVDLYCPGSPGCPMGGETGLEAGAASRSIAPDMTNAERLTLDLNMNGEFDEAAGDTFDDVDGDGRFEGEWIAGFGTGRAASAIHAENPPWARALALENDDVTVVFVSLDCVGLFVDEMDLIRARVDELLPDRVDYVFVSATHVHEARDTVGIWGASITDSGYSAEYMTFFREQAAQTVVEAVAALEPADLEIASFFLRDVDTSSDPGVQTDVLRYVGDNRDPFIFDDQVRVMRLVAADGMGGTAGTTDTISTFINYGSHPEYEGSRNTIISSDFAGWMRNVVEDGGVGPDGTMLPGVGGISLYVNGAVGVQIGPNYIHPAEWDGTALVGEVAEARAVGEQLGWHILNALVTPTETHDTFPLAFRRARFPILVQNTNYHIAFGQMLFGPRLQFDYDPDMRIRPGNIPSILTEVAVFDMGPIQMLTMPGELDPLLFVGITGDRAFTPAGTLVIDPVRSPDNPADLALFPTSGYLVDQFRADARTSDNMWLLGLTNDFTGYFVAPWDYELSTTPYLVEAEGDHYEETNSVGPLAWPRIERLTRELMAWTPP